MEPRAPLDAEELDASFRKDVDSDAYYAIASIPHDHEALEALALMLDVAEVAPDDDALCWTGAVVLN